MKKILLFIVTQIVAIITIGAIGAMMDGKPISSMKGWTGVIVLAILMVALIAFVLGVYFLVNGGTRTLDRGNKIGLTIVIVIVAVILVAYSAYTRLSWVTELGELTASPGLYWIPAAIGLATLIWAVSWQTAKRTYRRP